MILGIELSESSVFGVAADQSGAIVARERREGDIASAAVAIVRAMDGRGPFRIGAAVRDPGDEQYAAAFAAAADAAQSTNSARLVSKGAAVALAEQWCGATRGARHVVALTASDGVHAGMIVDDRVFEGAHGFAGAAGWLALNPVEREDYRRRGCLEAEAGEPGIVRRLVWRIKAGDASRVLDMAGGELARVTVSQVFDAARNGDGVAISVVRDTARYIGMAVGNLVTIMDPEVVVLGGLLADAADLLLDSCRAEAKRRVSARLSDRLRIVPGALGGDAVPLGAARAVMLAR